MSLLRLEALEVGYAGQGILPAVTLAVGPGEVWALVGRNGSGKTTLMRTALGLLPRVGGGVDLTPSARLAYVPQRGALDPSVPTRVVDHVRAGADSGWSFLDPAWRMRQRARVAGALEATEVSALARRPLHALSEGQKQRALIARALVGEPALVVLDEPTSAMDPIHETAIFELLCGLGVALVVATHTMSVVRDFATHCCFVDRERGVVRVGAADEVREDPAFVHHYGTPS